MSKSRKNIAKPKLIPLSKSEKGEYSFNMKHLQDDAAFIFIDSVSGEAIAELNYINNNVRFNVITHSLCHVQLEDQVSNLYVMSELNDNKISGKVSFEGDIKVAGELYTDIHTVKFANAKFNGKWISKRNKSVCIDENSIISVNKSFIETDNIVNHGMFNMHDTRAVINNNFDQYGKFAASNTNDYNKEIHSGFFVGNRFNQYKQAQTSFDWCAYTQTGEKGCNESGVNIHALEMKGGEFKVNRSNYCGDSINVYAGQFSFLDESLMYLLGDFNALNDASIRWKNAKSIVQNKFVTGNNTQSEFNNSYIKNEDGTLQGKLDIDDLEWHGSQLDISVSDSDIHRMFSFTNELNVQGGESPDLSLCFHDCQMKTGVYTQEGCVALVNESQLWSMNKDSTNLINGHLVLLDSKYHSQGLVEITKLGRVQVSASQTFDEKIKAEFVGMKGIDCLGVIALDPHTQLKGEYLDLFAGYLQMKAHSQAEFTGSIIGSQENISIDDGAVLHAKNLFVSKKLIQLSEAQEQVEQNKKINLMAKIQIDNMFYAMPGSSVQSQNSYFYAKYHLAEGTSKWLKSLSYAMDYIEQGTFFARGGHLVAQHYSAGYFGQIRLTDQQRLSAIIFYSNGDFRASNTMLRVDAKPAIEAKPAIKAKEIERTYSPYAQFARKSYTELKSNTLFYIEAGVMSGMMRVKTLKSAAPVIAGNYLTTTTDATLFGNSVLLRTENINQHGEIVLTGSLSGEGTRFVSSGFVGAKSINLGYDVKVSFLAASKVRTHQLSVNTKFYGNEGLIYANDAYHVNAITYSNGGVVFTANGVVNALLSNTGIVLPDSSSDVFTPTALISSIKSFLTTFLPSYSGVVQGIFSAISLGQSVYHFTRTCIELDKQFQNGKKSLRFHELIGLAAQGKGMVEVGVALGRDIGKASEEIPHLSEDVRSLINGKKDEKTTEVKEVIYNEKAYRHAGARVPEKSIWPGRILGAFYAGLADYSNSINGSYSENAILSANGYLALPAVSFKDIFGLNLNSIGRTGHFLSTLNIAGSNFATEDLTVDAQYNFLPIYNVQAASHLNVKGIRHAVHGRQFGINGLNYAVEHTDLPAFATVYGRNAQVKGKFMQLEGEFKLRGRSSVEIDKVAGEGRFNYADHLHLDIKERSGPFKIIGATTPKDKLEEWQKVSPPPPSQEEEQLKSFGADIPEYADEPVETQCEANKRKRQELKIRRALSELINSQEPDPADNSAPRPKTVAERKERRKQGKEEQRRLNGEVGKLAHQIYLSDVAVDQAKDKVIEQLAKDHLEKTGGPLPEEVINQVTAQYEAIKAARWAKLTQPYQQEVPTVEEPKEEAAPLVHHQLILHPQHILDYIQHEPAKLGEITGGDVTHLTGPVDSESGERTKCKGIEFEPNVPVNLKNGLLLVEKLTGDGQGATFENMQGEIDENEFLDTFAPKFYGNNYFKVNKKMSDAAQVGISGITIFDLKNGEGEGEFQHTGHVTDLADEDNNDPNPDKINLYKVLAKKGDLNGSADIEGFGAEFDNFSEQDYVNFLQGRGKYSDYKANEFLHAGMTILPFVVSEAFERLCDISLAASKVTYAYSGDQTGRKVYLKSYKDDTEILAPFNGEAFYADAEGKVYVAPGCDIYGRQYVKLHAVHGNVENHGAKIEAGNLLWLVADEGEVVGFANKRIVKTKYGEKAVYDPALFVGGDGKNNDNIGCIVEAKGKLRLVSSYLISQGHNILEAEGGFEWLAETSTYISKERKHTDAIHYHSIYKISTQTDVFASIVCSTGGQTILISKNGTVFSRATQIVGPVGADLATKPEFFSVKTNDQSATHESWAWGLKQREKEKLIEKSAPTLIHDDRGETLIRVREGGADFSGALLTGKGNLRIQLDNPNGEHLILGQDILNLEYYQHDNGIVFSLPGVDFYLAMRRSGNFIEALAKENDTAGKLYQFLQANGVIEQLAAAFNLGLNIYNAAAALINPSVSVGFSDESTAMTQQIPALGGLKKGGKVELSVPGGIIDFNNGAGGDITGDLDVNARIMNLNAAECTSTINQQSISVNVGVGLTTGAPTVGAAYSKTKIKTTEYIPSVLNVGGNFNAHDGDGPMGEINLGASILRAETATGGVKKVNLNDEENEVTQNAVAVNGNSSGGVGVFVGSGTNKTVVESIIDAPGLKIEETTHEEHHDRDGYVGVGLSANINSFINSSPPSSENVPSQLNGDGAMESYKAPSIGSSSSVAIPTFGVTVAARGHNVTVDVPVQLVNTIVNKLTSGSSQINHQTDKPVEKIGFQLLHEGSFNTAEKYNVPEQTTSIANQRPTADFQALHQASYQQDISEEKSMVDFQPLHEESYKPTEKLALPDVIESAPQMEQTRFDFQSVHEQSFLPVENVDAAVKVNGEDQKLIDEEPFFDSMTGIPGQLREDVGGAAVRAVPLIIHDLLEMGETGLTLAWDTTLMAALLDNANFANRWSDRFTLLSGTVYEAGSFMHDLEAAYLHMLGNAINPDLGNALYNPAVEERMQRRMNVLGNALYNFLDDDPLANIFRFVGTNYLLGKIFNAATSVVNWSNGAPISHIPHTGELVAAEVDVFPMTIKNTPQQRSKYKPRVVEIQDAEFELVLRNNQPQLNPGELSVARMEVGEFNAFQPNVGAEGKAVNVNVLTKPVVMGNHHFDVELDGTYAATQLEVSGAWHALNYMSNLSPLDAQLVHFIKNEGLHGRCLMFIKSGMSPESTLYRGSFYPTNGFAGNIIQHLSRGNYEIPVPPTIIEIFPDQLKLNEMAAVIGHEVTHLAFYRMIKKIFSKGYSHPFNQFANTERLDRSRLRDLALNNFDMWGITGKGIFSSPQACLFLYPQTYFNNHILHFFKRIGEILSANKLTEILETVQLKSWLGESEAMVLAQELGKFNIPFDVAIKAYREAYNIRLAEGLAWYKTSEIAIPGEAAKFIPNTLEVYKPVFKELDQFLAEYIPALQSVPPKISTSGLDFFAKKNISDDMVPMINDVSNASKLISQYKGFIFKDPLTKELDGVGYVFNCEYKGIYGKFSSHVEDLYQAIYRIYKIAPHYSRLADMLLHNSKQGICPIFAMGQGFACKYPNSVDKWHRETAPIFGINIQDKTKPCGYKQVTQSSIIYNIEGFYKKEQRVDHYRTLTLLEAGVNQVMYTLFDQNRLSENIINVLQAALKVDECAYRRGKQLTQFEPLANLIFTSPRQLYFNEVFIKHLELQISSVIREHKLSHSITKMVKQAGDKYVMGQLDNWEDLLVEEFTPLNALISPEIIRKAYQKAILSFQNKLLRELINADIAYPGELEKLLPHTMPYCREIFDQIFKYIEEIGVPSKKHAPKPPSMGFFVRENKPDKPRLMDRWLDPNFRR